LPRGHICRERKVVKSKSGEAAKPDPVLFDLSPTSECGTEIGHGSQIYLS
jgi:hypothetical protein